MPNEQKKLTCQQGLSKPKEPNMKMRMPGKDYTDPGYYFITMVVLGRRRLFGRIVGDANVPVGEPGSPAIEYSPYGIRIARALEHLGRIGPWAGLLEIKGKQVMPDHIHVLIYVKQRLPKVLGTVLNGFLITCRHEWRDMCSGEDAVHRDGYIWPLPEGQTSEPQSQEDGALRLFEKGFNDNVIYKAGQLDAYYHYMRNNPKRWLLKERYPELFVKRWIKEFLGNGIWMEKMEVIYNPCPKVHRDLSKKKKHILYAGTLLRRKGYDVLLKGFGLIASKYPEWKLLFIGNPYLKEGFNELEDGKRIANSLGISSQVEWLGWVSGEAKEKIFNESSIYCLPSEGEGFPMGLLDAWAYGIPSITTPVGGIPDIVRSREEGLLFPVGDTEKLAAAISTLIEDKALCSAIVRNTDILVSSKFNVEVINKQIENLYNRLL